MDLNESVDVSDEENYESEFFLLSEKDPNPNYEEQEKYSSADPLKIFSIILYGIQ